MKNKAAQQLGRLGGKVTSEAKTAAVRANGTKGGRPIKTEYVIVDRHGLLASHLDTIRGVNVPFSYARAVKRAREMNEAHGVKIYSVREA